MGWLKARLHEPSTYGAFGALGSLVLCASTVPDVLYAGIFVLTVLAILAGIALREHGS